MENVNTVLVVLTTFNNVAFLFALQFCGALLAAMFASLSDFTLLELVGAATCGRAGRPGRPLRHLTVLGLRLWLWLGGRG